LAVLLATSSVSAAVTVKLVKNVNPGSADSEPNDFTKLGTRVYFRADDGANGMELWRTDGTPSGTKLFKNINPAGGSDPNNFVVLGSRLYFTADDGIHGHELWKSDGTAAGTVMVKDINTDTAAGAAATVGSEPIALIVIGGVLYFYADDGVHGRELWKSNGSAKGTKMLADINPGQGDSFWCCPQALGSAAIFNAFDGAEYEMWRSNGSPATTSRIFSLGSQATQDMRVAGNRFFFSVRVGSDDHLGVSNGTPGGTQILAQLEHAFYLTALGNNIVFSGDDGTTGREPYFSDGTVGGTGVLKEIFFQGTGSDPRPWAGEALNGLVLFQAFSEMEGYELWRTDGTESGTYLVKDINPDGDSSEGTDYRDVLGNRLYFVADDSEHGQEPWITDGTEAGTMLLKDIVSGSATSNPTDGEVVGSFLYFTAENAGFGREIWRTNGTPASTKRVTDINPGPGDANPSALAPVGTRLYFRATNPTTGEEPYRLTP
jgi:ELWxxDGT repeat protein